MGGAATRLPLAEAAALAEEAQALLAPVCERIEIAGSIRRRKPDCGDIELVAIPTFGEQLLSTDLFGTQTIERYNRLDAAVRGLIATGALAPRLNKDGRQAIGSAMKWLMFEDFALDLFVCDPATWGVTFTIRTGSADFAHRLVTPTTQMGLCPPHLQFKGWRVQRRDGEIIPTPEERDVFEALGLPWREPWERA